jgi:sugar lactone lactonase YvrE
MKSTHGNIRILAARALLISLLLLTSWLSACGGSDARPIDRGPTSIALDADPNGAYWDVSEGRLYLTDDKTNRVLSWDGEGKTSFSTAVVLPALLPPATPTQVSLGQLTRVADKRLYATRFGFGNAGTVIEVSPAAAARNLTGLDARRRRIAITATATGELLESWFTAPPSPSASSASGNVSLLSVSADGSASERELVTGRSKPVGAVVIGRTLFVSDQATGKVLSFALDTILATPADAASGTTVATFGANLTAGDPGVLTADNIDLMTAAADGTLFFGGRGGKLYRVNSTTGAVTTIATLNSDADPGRLQIRGVAHDAANRRLFVAVHSTDTSKAGNTLRVFPID